MSFKHKAKCPKCATGEVTFTFQEVRHVSFPTVSMIVVEHNAPVCNACGRQWQPVMSAPQLGCTGLLEVKPTSDLTLATAMPKAPPPGSPGAA